MTASRFSSFVATNFQLSGCDDVQGGFQLRMAM
jgi:hypothetical protein